MCPMDSVPEFGLIINDVVRRVTMVLTTEGLSE